MISWNAGSGLTCLFFSSFTSDPLWRRLSFVCLVVACCWHVPLMVNHLPATSSNPVWRVDLSQLLDKVCKKILIFGLREHISENTQGRADSYKCENSLNKIIRFSVILIHCFHMAQIIVTHLWIQRPLLFKSRAQPRVVSSFGTPPLCTSLYQTDESSSGLRKSLAAIISVSTVQADIKNAWVI